MAKRNYLQGLLSPALWDAATKGDGWRTGKPAEAPKAEPRPLVTVPMHREPPKPA